MRQSTYLNVILTVNAFLVAALLWTQIAGKPLAKPQAQAQSRTTFPPPMVPNAAEQRQAMIQSLQQLNTTINQQSQLLQRGTIKVEVTNP